MINGNLVSIVGGAGHVGAPLGLALSSKGYNVILIDKNKENIKKNVDHYLNVFSGYPYIFNLGHGVLPETDPNMVRYIIDIIREKKA